MRSDFLQIFPLKDDTNIILTQITKIMNSIMSFQNKYARRASTMDWFFRGILMMLFFFASHSLILAQSNQEQSNQLETDKGIAAAIAPYDADVRQAILQASQHLEILIQLQKSQEQTVKEFQEIISGFNQKKQRWFYALTRYPDLTHTLATLPAKQSKAAVYKLLPNQDSDLQEAAWKLYKTEKKDLVKVDDIKIAAQLGFEQSIQGLDAPSKAAFQKLATMPDVLTLITNNIELTARLADHYKSNPAQLSNHLTALHDSINVQNQYEIAAFKKQLESDPQALKEYEQAAKDYSKSNGYNLPNQQSYTNNPNYYNASYYGNPYSYWYGYPYWYTSPMWYPGAFGFNSGFYLGMGGFGFYGFPSYGFSTWFFGGGYYNRYPHLYTQFGNYYHGNMGEHRVMGSVNHGFMGVANSHFNANGGTRLNTITSPSTYRRPAGQIYRTGVNTTHPNANTYHSQSWGSYGGRSNSMRSGLHGGGHGHR